MSPGKLFDYLDGTLSPDERTEIEAQLATDTQLRREMEVAREIHARAQGDSREVILEDELAASAKGRKMALRIGAAFLVLVALNVGVGLFVIARRESSNPNRQLIEKQLRDQVTSSLNAAAQAEMKRPVLAEDLQVTAEKGQAQAVADEIVLVAPRLGGTATRGLFDAGQMKVLVSIGANRVLELKGALSNLAGVKTVGASETKNRSETQTISVVVQVTEVK